MTVLVTILAAGLILSGCGKSSDKVSREFYVFYVNKENTKVVKEEIDLRSNPTDTDAMLVELLAKLEEIPEKPENYAPLSGYLLNKYELSEDQLTLDFHGEYQQLESIPEILIRAAVVRTLTQIEGIRTVTFCVEGSPLVDAQGIPVGTMAEDSFIDNAGTEINAYEKAVLCLYFATQDGQGLKAVNREVYYNSNIPKEKVVMEELIQGPEPGPQGYREYPTINPDTSIYNVTVQDGVCYVNLSSAFLTQIYNVSSEVTIYSITNSLAELPNVNKVQISIDGETGVTFRETIPLSNMFERNLDIVVSK